VKDKDEYIDGVFERRGSMGNQEQSKKGKGGLVIGFVIGLIIIALLIVIIYLLVARNAQTQDKEEKRSVVITQENAERELEKIDEMANKASVAPGYYTVTMNPTWHFKEGTETSEDAIVENVEANTNDVYFDIVLENDEEHVLYESPVIPRGGKLTDIALNEQLKAGTYPCVVIYHLIDDDQNTLSTLRVTLNIIVE
jgi:hypothetical protein